MSPIPFLLFLCWSVGVAATHAAPPLPEEVARLIRQLGDDDYHRREAASKRLASFGINAWPALGRTMKAPGDAEIRTRCARIINEGARHFIAPLPSLSAHTNQINTLAVSADSKRLLSGGMDTNVSLWNLTTDKEIAGSINQPGGIWAVAISPDGKRCLTSVGMSFNGYVKGKDHAIRVRNDNLTEVGRLVGHTDEIRSIVFLPDGKRALSAGLDRTIRLWDLDTRKEIRTFRGHTGTIYCLAVSPDGKQVLSSSQDRTVRCWNVETGEESSRFTSHQGDVLGVACLPDGKQAVSVGADKVARLWVIATGKEVRRFEGHTRCLSGVAVSPDGRWLLTSGGIMSLSPSGYVPAPDDHDIRLWEVATGIELYRFTGNTSAVPVVLFAPDGKSIFSGGADNVIRRWQFGIAPAQ